MKIRSWVRNFRDVDPPVLEYKLINLKFNQRVQIDWPDLTSINTIYIMYKSLTRD